MRPTAGRYPPVGGGRRARRRGQRSWKAGLGVVRGIGCGMRCDVRRGTRARGSLGCGARRTACGAPPEPGTDAGSATGSGQAAGIEGSHGRARYGPIDDDMAVRQLRGAGAPGRRERTGSVVHEVPAGGARRAGRGRRRGRSQGGRRQRGVAPPEAGLLTARKRSTAAGSPRRPTAGAAPYRPSPDDLAAAVTGRRAVPDVIDRDLDILFCGINPGRWSGAVGHHFAHPGNRFWKLLFAAGLTPELLAPEDERRLLDFGLGVTNLVQRTTTAAADLSAEELREGAARLVETVRRWRPATVAVLGLGAYRTAFARPQAAVGEQPDPIGDAPAWVLPNPSGLQGHYRFEDMVALLHQVRAAADRRGLAAR